jgi:hypothetical protein
MSAAQAEHERPNMAQEQAESWRATLADLWTAVDHFAENPGEWDEHAEDCETCADYLSEHAMSDPSDVLAEIPLEIVWELGEPFAVVLGTGGPHTEITGGGREGGCTLRSYWGGDRGAASGQAVTRTGEYFRELMES